MSIIYYLSSMKLLVLESERWVKIKLGFLQTWEATERQKLLSF